MICLVEFFYLRIFSLILFFVVLTLDISPGTHNFKFIQDGEWKYDPKWPFLMDPYGNINNVVDVPDEYCELHEEVFQTSDVHSATALIETSENQLANEAVKIDVSLQLLCSVSRLYEVL